MRKLIVYLILALAVVVVGYALAGTTGAKKFTADAGYRFTGGGPNGFLNAVCDGEATIVAFVITADSTYVKPQQGDMEFSLFPDQPQDVFISGVDSIYVDLGSGASYVYTVWGD